MRAMDAVGVEPTTAGLSSRSSSAELHVLNRAILRAGPDPDSNHVAPPFGTWAADLIPQREERGADGDSRDRTGDLVNAIHALSQLSYIPVVFFAAARSFLCVRFFVTAPGTSPCLWSRDFQYSVPGAFVPFFVRLIAQLLCPCRTLQSAAEARSSSQP